MRTKHETEIKQDMEGLVWNAVEILVENQNKTGYKKKQDMKNPEIWENWDMEIKQDTEINQNKEAQNHTQDIIQSLAEENNYIIRYINDTLKNFIYSCYYWTKWLMMRTISHDFSEKLTVICS